VDVCGKPTKVRLGKRLKYLEAIGVNDSIQSEIRAGLCCCANY